MSDVFDRTEAGPAVQEVDRLLRDFYQAELPDPWPRLALPARRSVRRAGRPFFRLALAASVALALLSYWAVAGLFPQTGVGVLRPGPEIGNKIDHRSPQKRLPPTPHPEAAQDEQNSFGGPLIPLVGPSDIKAMR